MIRIKLSGIIFIAVVARVAAIFLLGRNITPDVWEYDYLAKNILAGKGYVITQLGTEYHSLGNPLYAYIEAVFHAATNFNYLALELFNVVLSAFICYFIYKIGAKIYNQSVGKISALLAALHPGLIIYATKIHELTLVVFIICLIFWLIISRDYMKTSNDILIGCLIGAGMLARPVMIFFLPVYLIKKFSSGAPPKKIIISMALTSVIAFLMIAPWTARNYYYHKRLIFITTSSAEHFWRGNSAFSTGTALTADNKDMFSLAPKEFLDKLYSLDETGQFELFYEDTGKFVKSHPLFFAGMIARKLYYFWFFAPQTGLYYPRAWKYIYGVFYSVMMLFFIYGAYKSFSGGRTDKAVVISILLFCALVSILHSVYYIEIRHRWMVEPLIVIIASFGLYKVFEHNKLFGRLFA